MRRAERKGTIPLGSNTNLKADREGVIADWLHKTCWLGGITHKSFVESAAAGVMKGAGGSRCKPPKILEEDVSQGPPKELQHLPKTIKYDMILFVSCFVSYDPISYNMILFLSSFVSYDPFVSCS